MKVPLRVDSNLMWYSGVRVVLRMSAWTNPAEITGGMIVTNFARSLTPSTPLGVSNELEELSAVLVGLGGGRLT